MNSTKILTIEDKRFLKNKRYNKLDRNIHRFKPIDGQMDRQIDQIDRQIDAYIGR